MTTAESVAARLRTYRQQHNLTQAEMAERLGVHVNTVNRWESCEALPPVEVVVALAKLIGCTTDYLLGLTQTPSPLDPNCWLVDLDAVELLRSDAPLPEDPWAGWAVPIPRRNGILSNQEYHQLWRELQPRTTEAARRKRRKS